jgi:hypothetical protein
METIGVYVQILEKEITSLSGSADPVKEHEKLLLNQNSFVYLTLLSLYSYVFYRWLS